MNADNVRIPGPGARLILALSATILWISGCASLDATDDITRASTWVSQRSGVETGWASPWHEDAVYWDGHAPLSADAAVRVALQNNRTLRRQVESIVGARADFAQAHLLPNPIVNLTFGFPTDGLGGEPLTASLVQQLAWLWRRPSRIEAADAELRGRVLSVSDAGLRLVAEVRTAHAVVLFGQRAVELQEANTEVLERSVRLLENLLSVGEASQLDINRAELAWRAAQVELTDRRSGVAQAKRHLLAILGRADAGVDWVAAPSTSSPSRAVADLDEERVMHLAVSQRLDVAAAEAAAAAHAARLSLQEAERLPDVSVGIGYRQNFSDRPAVFPSVGLTPKVFDSNSAAVARAESEYRSALIDADRVRQQALAEARLAWVELSAQQEVLQAYEENILALAEGNLDLAQIAFDVGETDLTVLLEAQRRFNDARIQHTDRQLDATRLLIEVERAVGGSLGESIASTVSEATQ